MQLTPYSYDGHTFSASDDFSAYFPEGSILSGLESSMAEEERTGNFPAFTRQILKGVNIPLHIVPLGTIHSQVDTLKSIFSPRRVTDLQTLLAVDTSTSDTWALDCNPVGRPVYKPGEFVVNLHAPDPLWTSTTLSSATMNITSTTTTWTQVISVGGNEYARPVLTITPTNAKTGGFAYRVFCTILCTEDLGVGGAIDITNGGIDTAALVAAGKMQADGDDLRVFVNGRQVPRWLSATPGSSSACKIWVNLQVLRNISVTLDDAIGIGDNPTEITVQKTDNNELMLTYFKNRRPNGILVIGNEIFEYTGINTNLWKFTGVSRAARDTAAAAHSSGDTVAMVSNDVWIYYGNATMSPPSWGDETKPAFDVDTSTNTSHVYTSFGTDGKRNSNIWTSAVVQAKSPNTGIYTSPAGTFSSSWTEMGMTIAAWQQSGKWVGDSARLTWTLTERAGITRIVASGQKRRMAGTTLWATISGLQYSRNDGSKWVTAENISGPASASTWTAWSATTDFSPAVYDIRYLFQGSVSAVSGAEIDFEVQALTATLSDVFDITMGSENPAYELSATITNETTGESIELSYTMKVNKSLVVDCENRTIMYSNTNAAEALVYPGRFEWLTLDHGNNTITFVDTGTTGVTFNLKWYARHS